MGISSGLENIKNESDKDFIKHNSNKPFIRTMQDDLNKIKGSTSINGRLNSAVPSLVPDTPKANLSRNASKNISSSPISAPVSQNFDSSVVPKNLPIGISLTERADLKSEVAAGIIKPVENTKDAANSNIPDKRVLGGTNLSGREFVGEKKSVLAEDLSEISPRINRQTAHLDMRRSGLEAGGEIGTEEKINTFSNKPKNRAYLGKDTENLSPQARLARQTSVMDTSNNGIKYKESLIMPSLSKPSPVGFGAPNKTSAGSFNPIPPMSSSLGDKSKALKAASKENSSGSFLGKFIKFFFVILIIGGVAVGAYYLFVVKKLAVGPAPIDTPSESFVFDVAVAAINTDLNGDLIKEIKAYFPASIAGNNQKPSRMYRMIIKDKKGKNNLKIKDFKKSLNIVLPDVIKNVLDEDYNLIVFNYPEKNYVRLGFVFKSKNSFDISAFARSWEPDMYKDTKPIFFDAPGIFKEGKQFSGNKYNNFDIRYLPLGNENIALNYAIDRDKKFLLIATSKQDIFNLIDKIIKGK